MKELIYLGKQTTEGTLEAIEWTSGTFPVIKLHCSEFTSFCPVTNQPDYGKVDIEYIPDGFIAETKSVKLWLQSFRNQKGFNEQMTVRIAKEFLQVIQPKYVQVKSEFHPRGGISVETDYRLEKG